MTQLVFPYSSQQKGELVFFQSPANEKPVSLLSSWVDTPEVHRGDLPPGMILYGPTGAGKSHLLHKIQQKFTAPIIEDGLLDVSIISDALVLIDNVQFVSPDDLLNFYHVMQNSGRRFILTGKGKPQEWARRDTEELPDLMTRLASLPSIGLPAPDEALLAMTFQHELLQRQIRISFEVASTAAQWMRRSFHAAIGFASAIDKAALQQRRTIDKAFVREILKNHPEFSIST